MRKLVETALLHRNRLATAALATSAVALTNLAGAQTADTINGAAFATGAADGAQRLMAQGGPAIFGLVGVATGAIWILNRVRSLG